MKTVILAGALVVMVLGLAVTAPKAQAAQDTGTAVIELNTIMDMQKPRPAKKCIKKPRTPPGTGGPAQLPPGYRWC